MHVILPRILFGTSAGCLVGMIISALLGNIYWFVGTMVATAGFFFHAVHLLDSRKASKIGASIFAVPVVIAVVTLIILALQYPALQTPPEYADWILWFVGALALLATFLTGFLFMLWRTLKRW